MIKKTKFLCLLLIVTGCTNTQFQQAVSEGQLFCAAANGATVALQDTSGSPILAKGNTAAYVQAVCALVNAIPTSPPVSSARVSVVTVSNQKLTMLRKYNHVTN